MDMLVEIIAILMLPIALGMMNVVARTNIAKFVCVLIAFSFAFFSGFQYAMQHCIPGSPSEVIWDSESCEWSIPQGDHESDAAVTIVWKRRGRDLISSLLD